MASQFTRFFAGRGTTTIHEDVLSFDGSPHVDTGMRIRRDGTSSSFMSLHGLEARWDRIHFDDEANELALESDDVRYTYRVPPSLRRRR